MVRQNAHSCCTPIALISSYWHSDFCLRNRRGLAFESCDVWSQEVYSLRMVLSFWLCQLAAGLDTDLALKALAGIFLVLHSDQQALRSLLKLTFCVALIFPHIYSSAKIIYNNVCKRK